MAPEKTAQIDAESVTQIEIGGTPLDPSLFVSFGEAAALLQAAGYGQDFACKMRIRDAVGAGTLPALHRRSNFFLMLRADVEALAERLTAHTRRDTMTQAEAVELVCAEVGRSARVAAEWLRQHAAEAQADNFADRRRIVYDAERLRAVVEEYNSSSDREITTAQARELIVEHLHFAPGGADNLLRRKPQLIEARTRHGLLSFRAVATWINDTAERIDEIADAKAAAYERRTERLTLSQIVDDLLEHTGADISRDEIHGAALSLAKGRKINLDGDGKMCRSAIHKILQKLAESGFLAG